MTIVNGYRMSSYIKLKDTWCKRRLSVRLAYICMYLMIGKGQIAQQKDHIGAKIDLRAKFMGKYNCLVVY